MFNTNAVINAHNLGVIAEFTDLNLAGRSPRLGYLQNHELVIRTYVANSLFEKIGALFRAIILFFRGVKTDPKVIQQIRISAEDYAKTIPHVSEEALQQQLTEINERIARKRIDLAALDRVYADTAMDLEKAKNDLKRVEKELQFGTANLKELNQKIADAKQELSNGSKVQADPIPQKKHVVIQEPVVDKLRERLIAVKRDNEALRSQLITVVHLVQEYLKRQDPSSQKDVSLLTQIARMSLPPSHRQHQRPPKW